MIPSKLFSYVIYLGSSCGMFYVFDSRGTGTFVLKEQLHCTGIIDFALTDNEQFALTSSLDRTVNLIKMDHDMMELKQQVFLN